jgi:hypothetical protein
LQRAERCNTKPERLSLMNSVLRDFLREVDMDIDHHPDLFTVEKPSTARDEASGEVPQAPQPSTTN